MPVDFLYSILGRFAPFIILAVIAIAFALLIYFGFSFT